MIVISQFYVAICVCHSVYGHLRIMYNNVNSPNIILSSIRVNKIKWIFSVSPFCINITPVKDPSIRYYYTNLYSLQTTDNQQKHVKLTVKRHNRICITEIEYNLTILCENNDHEPGLLSLFGKGYCTVKTMTMDLAYSAYSVKVTALWNQKKNKNTAQLNSVEWINMSSHGLLS